MGQQNFLYVAGVSYSPHSAPAALTYGNGISQVYAYNAGSNQRALPISTRSGQNTSLLDLQYQWTGTSSTVNDGNLQGQTIKIDNATSFQQAYGYDTLNRLNSFQESYGTTHSGRAFSYDRFSNMWVSSNSGFNLDASTPVSATSPFDSATNRLPWNAT